MSRPPSLAATTALTDPSRSLVYSESVCEGGGGAARNVSRASEGCANITRRGGGTRARASGRGGGANPSVATGKRTIVDSRSNPMVVDASVVRPLARSVE